LLNDRAVNTAREHQLTGKKNVCIKKYMYRLKEERKREREGKKFLSSRHSGALCFARYTCEWEWYLSGGTCL